MSFDLKNYLLQEIHSDKIVILDEQLFAKNGELESNKIYIVIKYLASSIEFGAETQPVQILILSEQNGMQEAKDLFETFTQTHNWRSGMFDSTYVKQQYSSPVVMSNFNDVANGYRSVLYVSGTLFIMENICDVSDLKIGDVEINPISFNWSYQMSGNIQPIGGDKIASTVKNMSTFQASLSIPMLNNYISTDSYFYKLDGGTETVSEVTGTITVEVKKGYKISATISGGSIVSINQNTGVIQYITGGISATIDYDYECYNLLTALLKISSGEISGNIDFNITFSVFNVDFDYDCKLISLQMATTPNDVPTLQVGLQR